MRTILSNPIDRRIMNALISASPTLALLNAAKEWGILRENKFRSNEITSKYSSTTLVISATDSGPDCTKSWANFSRIGRSTLVRKWRWMLRYSYKWTLCWKNSNKSRTGMPIPFCHNLLQRVSNFPQLVLQSIWQARQELLPYRCESNRITR